MRGTTDRGRQGAARSTRVTWCPGLVQREGRRPRTPLLREIDRGLAKSRIGIVLVTPALLRRLQGEGIADKELSALLARDQLVPIVHETTYEALREISPLLGSRTGLSTAENRMAHVAAKLAELVAV